MFTEIFKALQDNQWPEEVFLRKRFELALVKKTGILKQPYHCRTSDPKINPFSAQLLGTALLLGDRDAYSLVEGIILSEEEDAAFAGKRPARQLAELIDSSIAQFAEGIPRGELFERLQTNIKLCRGR